MPERNGDLAGKVAVRHRRGQRHRPGHRPGVRPRRRQCRGRRHRRERNHETARMITDLAARPSPSAAT